MKKGFLKKVMAGAMAGMMAFTLVIGFAASGETVQAEENSQIYYESTGCSFDVRGVSNGQYISTTFGNGGYETDVQVGENAVARLSDDFDFGKIYSTNGVDSSISAQIIGNAVLVTYTLKNNNADTQSVKIGSWADTQVGDNDSAPVSGFSNGLKMTDGTNTFVLLPVGTNFTTSWYGYYGEANTNVFVHREDRSELTNTDSGIAWSWTVSIPAGVTAQRKAILSAGEASTYTEDYINQIMNEVEETTTEEPAETTTEEPAEAPAEESTGTYVDVPFVAGSVTDITGTDLAPSESNPFSVAIRNSTYLETLANVTEEEKLQGVNVWLDIQDASETMSDTDKNLIQSVSTDYNVGMYLDANLFKKVGTNDATKVTETNGMIQISFVVPENLRKDGRSYEIVRVHDGVPTILTGTYDESNYVFTFETNQFSSYAIIYKDTETVTPVTTTSDTSTTTTTSEATTTTTTEATTVTTAPKTGDYMLFVELFLVGMMVMSGTAMLVLKKKSE